MKHSSGPSGLLSARSTAALAGLLLTIAIVSLGAGKANAAEGDPFGVDFNYAGLFVGAATGGEINELVLTPDATDDEGAPLGPLEIRGSYTDDQGNFELPQSTGFEFPSMIVEIEGVDIDGDIGLNKTATGNYDSATGEMTLDAELFLTLSLDEISVLPEPIGSLGSGPLECRFAPLDVSLTTDPVNWPSPGQVFAGTEDLTDGAIAGGWNVKPKVTAVSGATICTILSGSIDSIGGVYFANSATPIAEMPDPTGPKPVGLPCPEGTTGIPGTPPEDCKPIVKKPPPPTTPQACPAGQTGTPPNCVVPTPAPLALAGISKVAVSPAKAKVRAGKSIALKVKVTNTGNAAADGVALRFKSSNKQVTVAKKLTISVAPGATVTKTVTVKAGRKAKGRATITATAAGRQGKAAITVQKAKAKKRR